MDFWDRNRIESYKDSAVDASKKEAEAEKNKAVSTQNQLGSLKAAAFANIMVEDVKNHALKVIDQLKEAHNQKLAQTIRESDALLARWEVSQTAFKKMAKAYGETLGKTLENLIDDNIYANIEVINENSELVKKQEHLNGWESSTEFIASKLKERSENYKPNINGVGDDFKVIKRDAAASGSSDFEMEDNPAAALLLKYGESLGKDKNTVMDELKALVTSTMPRSF